MTILSARHSSRRIFFSAYERLDEGLYTGKGFAHVYIYTHVFEEREL